MHVLFVDTRLAFGGDTQVLLRMLEALETGDVQAHYIRTPGSDLERRTSALRRAKPIAVSSGQVPGGLLARVWDAAKTAWKLVRTVRREEIRVIHTNNTARAIFFALIAWAAARRGTALVYHAHSAPSDTFLHRLAWKAARRIWAVSRATSEKYARAGADSGRIEVLHNGHDFESPIPDSKPLRRGLGIPDEAFVLCLVGRLSPNKGQHLAIEALARLESPRPLHLVLVGDDRIADGNSDYVSELKRAVVQHGLEGRVHFAGFQADPRPWYGVGDVVLIPSAEEGFPLTALEAAAAGVPMVATRATGLVEMLEEFGGLRCVDRSVDSLVAELEHLLLNPQSQSPTETRARLKAAFDLPAFRNRVLQAFARAASPTGNGNTPIPLHPWSHDECRPSVGSDC